MSRVFPTTEEVIAIHDILIDLFGGSHGLRDRGLLESAVMRPQAGYYRNIIEEAAALIESLALNHPFVDGNKRTAFFTADVFLKANGHYIDCQIDEAYELFIFLFETDSFRFSNLCEWLEETVKRRPID